MATAPPGSAHVPLRLGTPVPLEGRRKGGREGRGEREEQREMEACTRAHQIYEQQCYSPEGSTAAQLQFQRDKKAGVTIDR